MTIQQMLLGGGGPPLSGSLSGFTGIHRDPINPFPPGFMTVQASGNANVSGGSGTRTYQWSIQSGGATIVSGHGTSSILIQASVMNWSPISGSVRCIVSDSTGSVTLNGSYMLIYEAGIPP